MITVKDGSVSECTWVHVRERDKDGAALEATGDERGGMQC